MNVAISDEMTPYTDEAQAWKQFAAAALSMIMPDEGETAEETARGCALMADAMLEEYRSRLGSLGRHEIALTKALSTVQLREDQLAAAATILLRLDSDLQNRLEDVPPAAIRKEISRVLQRFGNEYVIVPLGQVAREELKRGRL